jgi:triosephosphate isomerase (TIM)
MMSDNQVHETAPRWRASGVTLGISLKMYFGRQETARWCASIAVLARTHTAVVSRSTSLFVLPSAPLIPETLEVFAGTGVGVGAQDLFWEDRGPYTGEFGGPLLRELGCTYAEVGHAERRRLFGEDDAVVAAKTAAALRNGLTPVLCIGEPEDAGAAAARDHCLAELEAALSAAERGGFLGPVVVAYEPQWAIGAARPASVEHTVDVCRALRQWLSGSPELQGSRVIYGGSAGPGLLEQLGDAVDGLFLGRFAHDPASVAAVLDETLRLRHESRRQ